MALWLLQHDSNGQQTCVKNISSCFIAVGAAGCTGEHRRYAPSLRDFDAHGDGNFWRQQATVAFEKDIAAEAASGAPAILRIPGCMCSGFVISCSARPMHGKTVSSVEGNVVIL